MLNKLLNFGQLVKDTSYEKFAILNQDVNISHNFIEKKSGSAHFSFYFIYENTFYGVWVDKKLGKIYISYDYVKDSPFSFSCTLNDHSENTLFINSARKYNCWKSLIDNYKLGNVRFENIKIKNVTTNLIKSLITS